MKPRINTNRHYIETADYADLADSFGMEGTEEIGPDCNPRNRRNPRLSFGFYLSGLPRLWFYCSSFDLHIADKEACDLFFDSLDLGRRKELFDPEHKDIDCPKCLRRRVYFDREIGYYCMFCGHVLTIDETLLQMDKVAAASRPATGSDKKGKPFIVEITAPPARRVPTEPVKENAESHRDDKVQ